MGRILVIEDDPSVREWLSLILQAEQYETLLAPDGAAGLDLLRDKSPDLVLLDWVPPRIDGPEVVRQVRKLSAVPVLMLTTRISPADRVAGLDAGADDYLAKPFQAEELLARIRAQLRRTAMAGDGLLRGKPVQVGDLRLEPDSHEVTLRGEQVTVSRLEFKLLYCLAERAGRILTRTEILSLVWGEGEIIDLRGIDAHIRRLRARIEDDPDQPRRIQTVHGIGYKMAVR